MRHISATRVIEASPSMDERLYFKAPLCAPVDISRNPSVHKVSADKKMLSDLLRGRRNYISIHTHPAGKSQKSHWLECMPSEQDLSTFLRDQYQRTMVIALRQRHGGRVVAYSFTRKTGKTPAVRTEADKMELSKALYHLIYFWDVVAEHVMKTYSLQHVSFRLQSPRGLFRSGISRPRRARPV